MIDDAQPLLTLEPFIEAVQDGVTRAGWVLSGLQKTTSHQFEGRWQGESSRSAYLFFHHDESPDFVSIDVFLDETTKGLKGNLALVVAGPDIGLLEPIPDLLAALAKVTADCLPDRYGTPFVVRLRMDGPEDDPSAAQTEVRIKLTIPPEALEAGASAVSALASATTTAFEQSLAHEGLRSLLTETG
ncbi:MAG: hypothetical protein VYA48_08415 [Gemmatimonadota bacterium]|nr:hypothetical protein [Gemmatimonadota bacterium]